MDIQKDLQISVLLDYYSDMLTDKQKDVIDLYYNEDLSLSEIAEHENITRQGVRDSIKRGEQTLFEMENKLHIADKSKKYYDIIEEVGQLAADIKEEASRYGNPKGIVKRAEYLMNLAEENKDLF